MRRSVVLFVILTVLAGLVMLAFSPASGGSQAVSASADNAPAAPTVVPASPFPLLALWDPRNWPDATNLLQPVDPLTLEPLPGYEPIEIERGQAGSFIESAISPDGTVAAFAAHIPGDSISSMDSGKVVLDTVDLKGWTDSIVAEWPMSMGYSATANPQISTDGSHIYWMVRTPGTGERTLHRLNLDSGTREQLATLPADFVSLDYRISDDRRTWFVFGVPVQQNLPTPNGYVLGEFAADVAQVLIVDLDSSEVVETVELDGVEAGAVPIEGLEDDGFPIRNTSPGLDWDLSSGRLHVGYFADNWDRGLIVDLNDGSVVKGFKLDAGASWLERLVDWLVPSVGAVARALSYGFALDLGDNGTVAFSSTREQLTEDRSANEMGSHAPVWAVDTNSGAQVWQSHLGAVHGLAESPVSGQLLVHSAERIFRLDAVSNDEGQALFLLDSATGDIVNRLDLPGRPSYGKDSMIVTDELVYIRTTTEFGWEVIVVDPVDLSIVGGWRQAEGEPSLYKLIPLP